MSKRKPYDGPRITCDPDDVIGTKEAAQILHVGEREIRYKIQRKKLPVLKIGGKYYIHAKAPLLYLKAQEILRPRWSSNRAERLHHRAADKINCCPGHALNPALGTTFESILTPDFLEYFGMLDRENIETRSYLRSLALVHISHF
jgi:excisionase family DNA binding protein